MKYALSLLILVFTLLSCNSDDDVESTALPNGPVAFISLTKDYTVGVRTEDAFRTDDLTQVFRTQSDWDNFYSDASSVIDPEGTIDSSVLDFSSEMAIVLIGTLEPGFPAYIEMNEIVVNNNGIDAIYEKKIESGTFATTCVPYQVIKVAKSSKTVNFIEQ